VISSVSNDLRQQDPRIGRSDGALESDSTLPSTQDETRGSTNLATRPRAGNISTDMRAGRPG
jgi:hypothetical protein